MTYFDHDYKVFPELTNSQLEVLQFSSPHPQIVEDFDAVIVKVIDGDTVRLSTSFRDFNFPLRMLDVDAPEMSEGGGVAKEWLRRKVEGCSVRVLIDSKNRVGRYGRLLGRILFNGLDLGREMIYLGLVVPFGLKKEGFVPVLSHYFKKSGAMI